MKTTQDINYSRIRQSCLIALGPQLGFRSVIDDQEGFLMDSKAIDVNENDDDGAVYKSIEGLLSSYGSGSSSAMFFATSVMIAAKSIKPLPLQLYQSLSIIDEIYQDVCSSVSFDPWKEPTKNASAEVLPVPVDDMVSDFDDTNWFFDNESSPEVVVEPIATKTIVDAANTTSDVSKWNELHGILQGLQHCLMEDWLTFGESHSNDDLARPMKLVMEVCNSLWCNSKISMSEFVNKLRSVHIKESEQHGALSAAYLTGCLKQSLEMLDVHVVHGIKINRSTAIPNSVMFQCKLSDAKNQRSLNESFGVVAVVCPELSDFGDSLSEGNRFTLGTSQQASSVSVQAVHTVDSFIRDISSPDKTESLRSGAVKAVTHLQRLNVSLLLCPQSAEDTSLTDACRGAGIAVLTMSRARLTAAAQLCGATVVETVLELDETLLGGAISGLRLDVVVEVPQQEKHVNSSVIASDDIPVVDEETDEPCVLLSLTAVTSGNDSADIYNQNTTYDSVSDFMAAHQRTLLPVSVGLCATTPLMAEALKTRFYRCLHRVRVMCESGGSVMPGGGVPELVTYLRLNEVIAERSSFVRDSSNDDAYVVIEMLKEFQSVLLDYCITVLVNNGSTYAAAQQRVDEARLALLHGYHSHQYQQLTTSVEGSEFAVDASIVEYVRGLSREQKCALPRPIRLSNIAEAEEDYVNNSLCIDCSSSSSSSSSSGSSGNNSWMDTMSHDFRDVVMDVPEVRVQSMTTALATVRQLYQREKEC